MDPGELMSRLDEARALKAAQDADRARIEHEANTCPFKSWVCQDEITGGIPKHDLHEDGSPKPPLERAYDWIGPIGGIPTCPLCGSTKALPVQFA